MKKRKLRLSPIAISFLVTSGAIALHKLPKKQDSNQEAEMLALPLLATIEEINTKGYCELTEEELNQITMHREGNQKDIPYEYCQFLKETDDGITLKEDFSLKYTIKKGDTIEKIIKTFYVINSDNNIAYNVFKSKLLDANNLSKSYEARVGDEIYIHLTNNYIIDKSELHLIEPGETIYSLSKKYNIDPTQLETLNGVSHETHLIYSGHYLYIPDTDKLEKHHNKTY